MLKTRTEKMVLVALCVIVVLAVHFWDRKGSASTTQPSVAVSAMQTQLEAVKQGDIVVFRGNRIALVRKNFKNGWELTLLMHTPGNDDSLVYYDAKELTPRTILVVSRNNHEVYAGWLQLLANQLAGIDTPATQPAQ